MSDLEMSVRLPCRSVDGLTLIKSLFCQSPMNKNFYLPQSFVLLPVILCSPNTVLRNARQILECAITGGPTGENSAHSPKPLPGSSTSPWKDSGSYCTPEPADINHRFYLFTEAPGRGDKQEGTLNMGPPAQ